MRNDEKDLGATPRRSGEAGSIASDAASHVAHTPGPWGWDSRNSNWYLLTFSSDAPHHIVAELKTPIDAMGLADQYLIAAAPDLLEAAKGLQFSAYPAHGSGFVCIVEGDLDALRKAIAKAEGC